MRSCRGEIKESLDLPSPARLTVGLAWHYRKYAGEQSPEDRERYAFAEVEAQARRSAMQFDCGPSGSGAYRVLPPPSGTPMLPPASDT